MNRVIPMCSHNGRFYRKDRSPLLVQLVKQFEYRSSRNLWFAAFYGRLFYQRMISQEVHLSGLLEGVPNEKRVLHVGCGPMPFTALALARLGLHVTALDNDPRAVEQARRVVSHAGLDHMISIVLQDGASLDPRPYDGVWISLHVYPRDQVIEKYLGRMRKESVLLYRNPKNILLRRWYPRCRPPWPGRRIPQPFGKESIIMHPPARTDRIPLSRAPAGTSCTIEAVPKHPLLSPLGIRPGKQVSIEAHCMFGGPIALSIDGRTSAVHRSLAGEILISTSQERQVP